MHSSCIISVVIVTIDYKYSIYNQCYYLFFDAITHTRAQKDDLHIRPGVCVFQMMCQSSPLEWFQISRQWFRRKF